MTRLAMRRFLMRSFGGSLRALPLQIEGAQVAVATKVGFELVGRDPAFPLIAGPINQSYSSEGCGWTVEAHGVVEINSLPGAMEPALPLVLRKRRDLADHVARQAAIRRDPAASIVVFFSLR